MRKILTLISLQAQNFTFAFYVGFYVIFEKAVTASCRYLALWAVVTPP